VHVALLPFLAISVLLILIPGPDTAMVTKNAVVGGRRAGIFAAVGVSIGLTIWTAAAALGIAALLRASAVAFFALKVAGALYLAWVGVQMLRSRGVVDDPELLARPASGLRALRQGVLSDLGNPKIAVFFTSLLPQFVHGHGSAFVSLLFLGVTFAALTLLWLAAYALALGHASGVLRRPAVRRALDRFTGVVLIGFGVRLAFEHRT
jgi:threonine/homoserine/homoserine lactone efflux protein